MALDDTHPTVRRLQIELLRRQTAAEKFAMVEQLSAMTRFTSRQAVAAAMPGAAAGEVVLRWIELVYGADLARRVAPHVHRLGLHEP